MLFQTPGSFVIGCNYWASHAGTDMWKDWRPDVVAKDFEALAQNGLQVVRVFPLWPDFQPLTQLYGGGGRRVEIRHGENPWPHNELGRSGIDPVAMAHFQELADLAQEKGLSLVVGLVTGWMSGRWFVPPALEGRNPLKDSVAMKWELRFVHTFVKYFQKHPAIGAWDLGNECNCMGGLSDPTEAWLWTAAIVNTIQAVDSTRPVVSGMHSLKPTGSAGIWLMEDQGELCDVLTTHPYPRFTPLCDLDPLNTLRPSLHAVAESRLYADMGEAPCLVEEIGTLGPMYGEEETAAAYIRTVLFNAWAGDCRGLLWWCGFEQLHLEQAPYDWHVLERELGLFRSDGSPKPVVKAMSDFRRFLDDLPFEELPKRLTDGLCLVTAEQDSWALSYAAYVLARQAGGELSFQNAVASAPLADAPLYVLAGLNGPGYMSRRRWLELLDKVSAGATLYLSLDDTLIPEVEKVIGAAVVSRSRRRQGGRLQSCAGAPVALDLPIAAGSVRYTLRASEATTVMACEDDGNPVLICSDYGKGRVITLGVPMEKSMATTPGVFTGDSAWPFWQLYRWLFASVGSKHAVQKQHPELLLSEHPMNAHTRVLVAVNASPQDICDELELEDGWLPSDAEPLRGARGEVRDGRWRLSVAANDAVVHIIKKQ
ncbi:MAG: beta-mannanase [Lentisphaeria bacterium]|nr:beta-mannanase [Lentisphaeria bacterium]